MKINKELKRKKIKCLQCKNVFYIIPSRSKIAKFCSNKCKFKYFKKHQISAFYDSKLQGKNCRKAIETNKKNKTGLYDPRIQSMGGKITSQKYPNLAKRRGKMSAEVNRKRGTSAFFDKKIQIKGGLAAQKTLRENVRNLKHKGQYYDSPDEAGFSMSLQKQYNYIPIEGKTLHIKMKGGEIDYLFKKLKLFIEYHVWFQNETEQEYYKRRRKILNQNGYENYSLIVTK